MAIFGFTALGFVSNAIGRKPTAMLYYLVCLVLTPVVYLGAQSMGRLLVTVAVFGFFTGGLGADLAYGAVPDAHARQSRCVLL